MLRNYLVVAIRNLLKSRLYSFVNVFGLAVGLTACILILLFVREQLSYDRFWQKADRIHRLHTTFEIPGREPLVTVAAQGPSKAALERFFPEVERASRLNDQLPTLTIDGKVSMERVVWVDPEIADILDFIPVRGDVHAALGDNSSLVLTRSMATTLFGHDDVIDEVVTLSNWELLRDYRVAAIIEDLPDNSVLDIPAMVMIDEGDFTNQPWFFSLWFSVNNVVLFELVEEADISAVRARLDTFADENIDVSGQAGPDNRASDFIRYSTQALPDVQLHPTGLGEMKPTGDMTIVVMFSSVAALILLIACINFMNLTTARSTQRAREVALRKVVGASRSQLVIQFLGESLLLAFVSLLVALALVEMIVPWFGGFLGLDLSLELADPVLLGMLAAIVLVVGLVGGSWPALVLSNFRPSRVLHANRSAPGGGSTGLRGVLVVFQFAVSIALTIGAGVVFLQMSFGRNLDPGYQRDNMLVVRELGREAAAPSQQVLRNEILALPGVHAVSLASERPGSTNENNTSVEVPGLESGGPILIGVQDVDHDFFETLKIPILAGRDYSRDRLTDAFPEESSVAPGGMSQASIIVNESALDRFGYGTPEQAIGKPVRVGWGGTDEEPGKLELTIIGVVPDVHFQSLKSIIRPEIYRINSTFYDNLVVRFDGDPEQLVATSGEIWARTVPEVPFRHEFVDQALAAEFDEEERQAQLLASFATLAVVIACLGLYGLASFTAQRRTREIGIRKVMGAGVRDIVQLLVWQFSRPVLIANLIAWPVASWLMLGWLEQFPYRIATWTLAPLCVASGLLALLVAWATVGGNAARVARANPVHALRYE